MSMTKQPTKLVLSIGVIAIVLACLFRFGPLNKTRSVKTDISTTLTEAINISELSTAEFRYKGIAEEYKDEEKTKVKCRICYSAIVKAGIDMKDVKIIDVDTSEKIVTLRPSRSYMTAAIITGKTGRIPFAPTRAACLPG